MKTTRDVQIHAALTIRPSKNSVVIFGEKDNEIAQFCVQLDSKFAPFTKMQFDVAFEGLKQHILDKARSAGLLRAGQ